MKFMLIVEHHPMYNPSVWFEWEPLYFRFYFTAFLTGLWYLATRPYSTNATIYRRKNTHAEEAAHVSKKG